MRKVLLLSTAVCLVLSLGARAQADDDCRAIIEKAIQARGGADKLAKLHAVQAKTNGTLEIMGMSLAVSIESSFQFPAQMKSVIEMDIMGQKVHVTQGYDKGKAWAQAEAAGQLQNIDLPEAAVSAMKEALHSEIVGSLLPLLKEKDYTMTPLGEVKVQDRTALGVKVACKGYKDVNLYFDKETGLPTKMEGTSLNTELQEVNQEVLLSDYKDYDGVKRPSKLTVIQNGKKLMDAEVIEIKFVDKIDDSEFAKP